MSHEKMRFHQISKGDILMHGLLRLEILWTGVVIIINGYPDIFMCTHRIIEIHNKDLGFKIENYFDGILYHGIPYRGIIYHRKKNS